MRRGALVAFAWTACIAGGCADDSSTIEGRTGSGDVEVWDLPPRGSEDVMSPRTNATVIPVRERVDMLHDAKRNVLYVSTSNGSVRRWSLETRSSLAAWVLGSGRLGGMDLSPDGDALVVAEQVRPIGSMPRIHHIDLDTESLRPIEIPASDQGTLSVAFIDDARVMVAMSGLGPTQLRIVTLDDNQSEAVHEVKANTVLAADPKHAILAYGSLSETTGPFGSYSIAENVFRETRLGTELFDIAVSPGGERYAATTATSLKLLDSNLSDDSEIRIAGSQPVGVAFGTPEGSVSVTWLQGDETRLQPAVEVYDATSGERIAQLDDNPSFKSFSRTPFPSGHMKTSHDGRLLFVSIDEGILELVLGL